MALRYKATVRVPSQGGAERITDVEASFGEGTTLHSATALFNGQYGRENVIMVRELRDIETARPVAQAQQTSPSSITKNSAPATHTPTSPEFAWLFSLLRLTVRYLPVLIACMAVPYYLNHFVAEWQSLFKWGTLVVIGIATFVLFSAVIAMVPRFVASFLGSALYGGALFWADQHSTKPSDRNWLWAFIIVLAVIGWWSFGACHDLAVGFNRRLHRNARRESTSET